MEQRLEKSKDKDQNQNTDLDKKQKEIAEQLDFNFGEKLQKIKRYTPVNGSILTEPSDPRLLKKSGLILPENIKPTDSGIDVNTQIRRVLAVSYDIEKKFEMSVKPGDYIIAGQGGVEFKMEGLIVQMFKFHQIDFIVKEK